MAKKINKEYFKGKRLLVLIGCVLIVVIIVVLKLVTPKITTAPIDAVDPIVQSDGIAVPDTSSTSLDTISDDAVGVPDAYDLSQLDTTGVGVDARPAQLAGYEDGMQAGKADAAIKSYKDSYDETNAFRGDKHAIYIDNYRKGYEVGFYGNAKKTEKDSVKVK